MKNYILFLFLIFTSVVKAQDPISNIIGVFNKFTTDYPQEKVHLHFDKPYYVVGDTIWFKSYVVTASNGLPTNLSSSLSLNVVDEKDSVVFSKKLPLFFGLGAGMVALPFSLKKGKYAVYAYTPWMQNFDKSFFFKKVLSIENPFAEKPPVKNAKKNTSQAQLAFFPEGGDLIMDIRSKVAFKYIGVNGLGKDVKGDIVNEKGDKITSFESGHLGMGIFAITPKAGETYTAVIEEGGAVRKIALPSVKTQGYVFSVNNLDATNLLVKIAVSSQLVDGKELILIGQVNGVIKYAAKMKSQAAITTLIPKSELPTGVTHLTLFNSSQQPLVERLVFINHNDHLNINIKADKEAYAKREKVSLALDGNLGSYSIAVTHKEVVPSNEEDETSILSNLLLTSDLKGYIEKPGYYFGADPDAPRFLDYLMLTQGWRRFKWSEVMSGAQKPLPYLAEKNISISGIVTTASGSPIPNTNVKLISSKGTIFAVDTLTSKDGRFVFDELSFTDSASFILQAKYKNESRNVKIILDPIYQASFKSAVLEEGSLSVDLSNFLTNSKQRNQEAYSRYFGNQQIQLKQVEIRGQRKKIEGLERSANLNGAGNADKVITAEAIANETDLYDYIGKAVLGVTMENGQIVLSRSSGTSIEGSDGPAPVQFIVDGTMVSQDFIVNLPVDNVEIIEVLRNAALTSIYGSAGYGGVILISTKRGVSNRPSRTPGIQSLMLRGFDRAKEFYSPQYTPTVASSKPDLRSTIYWNPNIITDKEGKATIHFYTSDGIGSHNVVVEGINLDGKIGRRVINYTVK